MDDREARFEAMYAATNGPILGYERAFAIKSRTVEPGFTVKAGTVQRLMVRVAIGVVAEAGRRP